MPRNARSIRCAPTRRASRAARSGSQHEKPNTRGECGRHQQRRPAASWWSATAWRGCAPVEELLKLAPDLYDITVFGAERTATTTALLSPRARGREDRRRHHHQLRATGTRKTASRCMRAIRWSKIDRVRRVVRSQKGIEAHVRPPAARHGIEAVHHPSAGSRPARRDRVSRHPGRRDDARRGTRPSPRGDHRRRAARAGGRQRQATRGSGR